MEKSRNDATGVSGIQARLLYKGRGREATIRYKNLEKQAQTG